ncbi:MAG: hypothetical protein AAF902_10265 [Chloroflexota bacterium]
MINSISRILTAAVLMICLLLVSSTAPAQAQTTFEIDVYDGEIDAAWDSVPALAFNDFLVDESGEGDQFGDIISAWFVFDKPDPSKLYFRVDGYDIIDSVSLMLDCDGDQLFNSVLDREILFYTFDDLDEDGEIEGELDYTSDYLIENNTQDYLDSGLFSYGEFVLLDDDPTRLYVSFEAEIDLSDDFDDALEPCFASRDPGDWKLYYKYETKDGTGFVIDETIVGSNDILTAVTMSGQSAHQARSVDAHMWMFGVLVLFTLGIAMNYGFKRSKTI